MTKLDLHGFTYEQARSKTIRFIENYWDQYITLTIITGQSLGMRNAVIEVLDEYNLAYRVGDFLGMNKGHLEVFMGGDAKV